MSGASASSQTVKQERRPATTNELDATVEDDNDQQDILELWFAVQHGDIGGGWNLSTDEKVLASDLPLMWILRKARKAGMPFDEDKVRASHLFPEDFDTILDESATTPMLQLNSQRLTHGHQSNDFTRTEMAQLQTSAKTRDSLSFGKALSFRAVLGRKVMEHLPFRRMHLQADRSWKPISWPLPRGEVRDIPSNAMIHGSVIRRMKMDESYPPDNVIVGSGARAVRRAPADAGIGEWQVFLEEGDMLGEIHVRETPEAVDR